MIKEIGDTSLGSAHTAIKMWEVWVESGKRPLREHRHINFEIALVLDGSGIYHTTCGQKSIQKGNIFIYTSNEPHCIIEAGKQGLHILNLHFSSTVMEMTPLLKEQYPFAFYSHAPGFDCKIEEDPALSQRLMEMREEFLQRKSGYSCVIVGLISDFLISLIRSYGFYQTDAAKSDAMQKLDGGIQYINAHYCESIVLEEIARHACITPNYFCALFRRSMNMKLWDYITAKRIEKAKRLLHDQNCTYTVLDIAAQCGFNNSANFNRAFRQHTGITPSQYRKNRYENII